MGKGEQGGAGERCGSARSGAGTALQAAGLRSCTGVQRGACADVRSSLGARPPAAQPSHRHRPFLGALRQTLRKPTAHTTTQAPTTTLLGGPLTVGTPCRCPCS